MIRQKVSSLLLTWEEEVPDQGEIPRARNKPDREIFSVHFEGPRYSVRQEPHKRKTSSTSLKSTRDRGSPCFRKPEGIGRTRPRAQSKPLPRKGGPGNDTNDVRPLTFQRSEMAFAETKHRWKSDTNLLEQTIQQELARHLSLDKDKLHRSYSCRVLWKAENILKATKFQGDTALTIPPFLINAGRGTTRIWGQTVATMQPTMINCGGLNQTEQEQVEPLLTVQQWRTGFSSSNLREEE